MARAIIVDENEKVIGAKERDQILPTDIQQITGLWLTNSKGEVLLAQRQITKKNDPGKWGPAAAGTV
jgi:isopentenyldiphosphate isomerase